jgi:TonB family protein
MWSINRIVFPEKEKDLNLELRQVEYLLKAPIQARELFEEPVKELEKEKLKEKTPPKKTSQNLKNKGLLGQLEKQKNFQGVLEMKELDNVLQGVGVLTAKRPQGYKSTGPQIAYRSASNMDDMVAGISKRSGGDVGGSQKRNVAVSNPFDVSGSGAQHELRSYQEIDRIIRRHLQGIRYLYERYLRSEPLLRGRVELVFTISAQGAVTDCQVKSSSMNHPSFEQELLRRVKLWKFPAIDPSGGNVRVVYPFSFIPKGD